MELLLCMLILIAVVCLIFSSLQRKSENFKSDHRYTFVKFYAPWCGYCQRLAPEWKKLKAKYSHKVGFEEYNCDIQKDMCSKNDITGYPTLKVRDNVTKRFLQYDGPREYNSMAAFLDTVIGR